MLASLAVVALMLGAGPATAQAPQPAEARKPPPDLVLRGDAKCTRCHNEEDDPRLLSIGKTRHGVNADRRTPTCTTCHGESENHINKPAGAKERPKPDRIFARNNETTPAEAQNGACLICHRGGSRVHWQGSGHSRSQLACASCHSVHAARDQVLVKATQAGVCFTCHQDKRADIFRFSTHPLRTGWMTCSSCHAPHGSATEPNLIRNTVNETCYTCHADKRGPFLWEHPPVRENCAECHNPHGANNPAMLKVRGPFLCQQCHIATQHPSTLYSGSNLPPNLAADKMLGQQCANCHSKVHGSNHPSGARFTR
ncbi:MAG: DmsE family decaheme c-type cytochrome [Burkholderiales bacterium]|nr:DmsE family decaheme c-type cytochrome [Burkholderiales bacterium]